MPGKSAGLGRTGLALGLAASLGACGQKTPPPPPKPEVGVVTLHGQPVPITTVLTARVTSYRVAEIRPQVGGVILTRLFTEGQDVKAQQQLYQIDPAPSEASLATAKATLAHAEAGLASAQATVDRYRPLAEAQAVSRQDLDNAIATMRQSEADVASGQAGVKTAAINLAYTRVLSPIAGRTGRSSVTEGALVAGNQTTSLVTVTQLDPVYVDATEAAGTLIRFKRELAAGAIKQVGANAAPVKLLLEDGTAYDQTGKLQFSEVVVDQTTGSVTLRAIFPNPQTLLLPGMFVRETLEEGVRQNALLVPQRGITRDPKGDATAMVVGGDNKVARAALVTDRAIGTDWLVTSGLKDGDRVIVDGVQKVHPGADVNVKEAAAELPPPAPDGAAKP